MRFAAAPEYQVFPTRDVPLKPYAAAVKASAPTRDLIRELDPEVVVADIITVAGSLAAQAEGRPWATLVPHVLPTGEPGFPIYSVGAVYPRSAAGATNVGARTATGDDRRGAGPHGVERGARACGAAAPRRGARRYFARPRDRRDVSRSSSTRGPPGGPARGSPDRSSGSSRSATWSSLRATRRLSWWRRVRRRTRSTGWCAPRSTGLAGEPVRVLATTNRREPAEPLDVPANARLVDWVSYARTMPLCDAVVCHAGHGTLARALASGTPVVACPHAGDMAENAARIRWAGAGVSLPRRFTTPLGIRLAVRRVLAEPGYRLRAEELRDWATRNDGASAAADAVEEFAESHKNAQIAG